MKKEDLKNTRQYRNALNNNKAFLSIPTTWCVRFDLTPTELMILRHIQYMSKLDAGVFTGSIKGLCSITNCSAPTARKACMKLHNLGFIRKIERQHKLENGKIVDWICYRANVPYDIEQNDKTINDLLKAELERRNAIGYITPIKGKTH